MCSTASLGAFDLDLLGGWSGWVPPGAGNIMLVLPVGDDVLMRVLISLGLIFLCPKASFISSRKGF